MEVYIEYVIIDNFAITYFIGVLAYRALKVRSSLPRLFFGALFGTVVAVFYPFINLGVFGILGIRLTLLVVISLILFHKKSKFFISTVVFFGITMLFGGVFFAIGFLMYADVTDALSLPVFNYPIYGLLILTMAVFKLLKQLIITFHRNRASKSNAYRIGIRVFDKSFEVEGFCDTGNHIFDLKTGLPVAVVGLSLAMEILNEKWLIDLLNGREGESYPDARYIECCPFASKPQRLWLVRPQKFLLYFEGDKNINIDVMLGLSINALSSTMSHPVIFGTSVLLGADERMAG